MGIDDQIGSIEVGKLADLIVLEKNLFEVPPEEIHQVKALYTIMNGDLVYEARAVQRRRRIPLIHSGEFDT